MARVCGAKTVGLVTRRSHATYTQTDTHTHTHTQPRIGEPVFHTAPKKRQVVLTCDQSDHLLVIETTSNDHADVLMYALRPYICE